MAAATQLRRSPVERPELHLFTAACGYAGCINLSGPSEVTLVTNRGGVLCCGCGVVRYCCAECAAKAWPAHCKECKQLRASNKAQHTRRDDKASLVNMFIEMLRQDLCPSWNSDTPLSHGCMAVDAGTGGATVA
jgi:hypothetical protein